MEIDGGPRGIPSLTYVRICPPTNTPNNGQFAINDVSIDGNSVIVNDSTGQYPPTRHEVAEVLDRNLSDEDVCEHVIGSKAGSGVGAALNPVTAFVHDAATAVLFVVGSRQAKKWRFMKVRTVNPYQQRHTGRFILNYSILSQTAHRKPFCHF